MFIHKIFLSYRRYFDAPGRQGNQPQLPGGILMDGVDRPDVVTADADQLGTDAPERAKGAHSYACAVYGNPVRAVFVERRY